MENEKEVNIKETVIESGLQNLSKEEAKVLQDSGIDLFPEKKIAYRAEIESDDLEVLEKNKIDLQDELESQYKKKQRKVFSLVIQITEITGIKTFYLFIKKILIDRLRSLKQEFENIGKKSKTKASMMVLVPTLILIFSLFILNEYIIYRSNKEQVKELFDTMLLSTNKYNSLVNTVTGTLSKASDLYEKTSKRKDLELPSLSPTESQEIAYILDATKKLNNVLKKQSDKIYDYKFELVTHNIRTVEKEMEKLSAQCELINKKISLYLHLFEQTTSNEKLNNEINKKILDKETELAGVSYLVNNIRNKAAILKIRYPNNRAYPTDIKFDLQEIFDKLESQQNSILKVHENLSKNMFEESLKELNGLTSFNKKLINQYHIGLIQIEAICKKIEYKNNLLKIYHRNIAIVKRRVIRYDSLINDYSTLLIEQEMSKERLTKNKTILKKYNEYIKNFKNNLFEIENLASEDIELAIGKLKKVKFKELVAKIIAIKKLSRNLLFIAEIEKNKELEENSKKIFTELTKKYNDIYIEKKSLIEDIKQFTEIDVAQKHLDKISDAEKQCEELQLIISKIPTLKIDQAIYSLEKLQLDKFKESNKELDDIFFIVKSEYNLLLESKRQNRKISALIIRKEYLENEYSKLSKKIIDIKTLYKKALVKKVKLTDTIKKDVLAVTQYKANTDNNFKSLVKSKQKKDLVTIEQFLERIEKDMDVEKISIIHRLQKTLRSRIIKHQRISKLSERRTFYNKRIEELQTVHDKLRKLLKQLIKYKTQAKQYKISEGYIAIPTNYFSVIDDTKVELKLLMDTKSDAQRNFHSANSQQAVQIIKAMKSNTEDYIKMITTINLQAGKIIEKNKKLRANPEERTKLIKKNSDTKFIKQKKKEWSRINSKWYKDLLVANRTIELSLTHTNRYANISPFVISKMKSLVKKTYRMTESRAEIEELLFRLKDRDIKTITQKQLSTAMGVKKKRQAKSTLNYLSKKDLHIDIEEHLNNLQSISKLINNNTVKGVPEELIKKYIFNMERIFDSFDEEVQGISSILLSIMHNKEK